MNIFSVIILDVSIQFRLDPNLIKAIIWQESAGNSWACRYEPKCFLSYEPMVFSKELNLTVETELTLQRSSWGLMQPLGVVAREMGFQDYLPKLCLPENGIYWGCKKLAELNDKYQDLDDVIASYNAGSPKKMSGKYINQNYVNSVKLHLYEARIHG